MATATVSLSQEKGMGLKHQWLPNSPIGRRIRLAGAKWDVMARRSSQGSVRLLPEAAQPAKVFLQLLT